MTDKDRIIAFVRDADTPVYVTTIVEQFCNGNPDALRSLVWEMISYGELKLMNDLTIKEQQP